MPLNRSRVFCLAFHASYGCRHSGACCRAGWDIAAEPAVLEAVTRHVVTDEPDPARLFQAQADGRLLISRRADGDCVFYEAERGRLCAIHRQAGAINLPSACRHFPRVVLRDPRGTFVTLSHFCPTAASMLRDPGPIRIVEAPPSLALDGSLEGLDATAVLPPLLRPGVLMDHEGLSAWERAGIAVLDRDGLDVDAAVEIIAAATDAAARWSPGRGSLAAATERAFDTALQTRSPRATSDGSDRPLRAFIAAHLFASWDVYQSAGIQGAVRALRTALVTLRQELRSQESFLEAARAADLRLRHTAA